MCDKTTAEDESKFRILFEELDDGVTLTHQGVLVDVNHKMVRMLGLSDKAEILGRSLLDFMTPESRAKSLEAIGKIQSRQSTQSNLQLTYVRMDGSEITVEMRGSKVEIDGKTYGLSVHHDITDRIRTEEVLRQSMESYRALVEGSPDVIMRFDTEGRHLFVSKNVNEVVALEAAQFTGKTHRGLGFSEALCEMWEGAIHRVRDTGESYETEFSFEVKRGHTVMNWRLVPEFDAAGKVGSVLSISRDITKQKLIEDRFRKFFSQVSQLAYIVSPEGVIIEVNDAVVKRLGYDEFELIGQPLTKLYAEESLEKMSALFAQWKATGLLKNEEMVIRTKTGEKRTVLLNASVVRDEHGAIVHSVSLQTDITELKKLQDEVARSQKLESLGILAGGIAHDFNNLLGGIFGYVDMAAEETKEKLVAGYLVKALGAIDRARGLTRQLLTFAKGGVPVKKIDTLPAFIRETSRFALSGSNVSCRFDFPEDLWMCEFDRNQIGQVMDNIIINAQQAMPGGGEIEISAVNTSFTDNFHSTLPTGKYVRISIKDRGIGMPGEILPRIFDPFFTTKTKGHGLGLATSYSIVNRHGGCIDVESEPGKGSVFHVYIPASPGGSVETASEIKAVHKGSGTMLVMDDEEVMRETIEDMLTNFGYSVICVANGSEALEDFRARKDSGRSLSGMILDLTIPGGMGGREVIMEIRKNDGTIPVFVASGYSDDPVMASPADYGFTASICKPFRLGELAEMLERHSKREHRKTGA